MDELPALRLLDGAYEPLRPDERTVYRRALADLDVGDVEEAILALIATRRRRPSIAEIRTAVLERRLALPDAATAWLAVVDLAKTRAGYVRCDACNGSGEKLGERVYVYCPSCAGAGEVEVARSRKRAALPAPARAALDFLGGSRAIREHDRPEILRAQFVREYERLRLSAIETANLESAGLAPATLTRGDATE